MGLFSKPTKEELEKKINKLKDQIDNKYDLMKSVKFKCQGESLRMAIERYEADIANLQDEVRELEHKLRKMS